MSNPWQCEFCGGSASWTFVESEVLYLCHASCHGALADGDPLSYVDRVGSVSALEDEDGKCVKPIMDRGSYGS